MNQTTVLKRTILALLALVFLLSCTACGKSAKVEKAEEESAFASYFTDKLYAVSQNYHPGTAGCSLVAATLAAEIMDLFTEYAPSAELIKNCMKEFTETLTDETFSDSISAIISAAEQLNGENGKDFLDSSGYTGDGYPWNAEKMAECFAAMKLS